MCEWYCRYGYVYKHHGSSNPDAHLSAYWQSMPKGILVTISNPDTLSRVPLHPFNTEQSGYVFYS